MGFIPDFAADAYPVKEISHTQAGWQIVIWTGSSTLYFRNAISTFSDRS